MDLPNYKSKKSISHYHLNNFENNQLFEFEIFAKNEDIYLDYLKRNEDQTYKEALFTSGEFVKNIGNTPKKPIKQKLQKV